MHNQPDHRALFDWLHEHGARTGPLRIGEHGGVRGLVAAAGIAKGEVVLELPRTLLLTIGVAQASEVGQAVMKAYAPGECEDATLAAFLLRERAAGDSFWKPYLDLLPEALPGFPLFFEPEVLDLLRGSSALETIAGRRAFLREEHALLSAVVPALSEVGFAQWAWARSIVTSRTFSILQDGKDVRCMIPLADLLNHATRFEVEWDWSESADAFVLRAQSDLAAGSPVRNSYGQRNNRSFFLNYGFAPEEPEHDEAVLKLATPLDPLKLEALGFGRPTPSLSFPLGARTEADAIPLLLKFLRVACAAPEELRAAAAGAGPVSLANEVRAVRALATACQQRRDRFATTLEEDEALLADAPLLGNRRMCVVVRRGEKRVLRRHLEQAERALAMLSSSLEEAERLAAQEPPGPLWAAALLAARTFSC